MKRADWQLLAEERLLAANDLLQTQRWSSAYYLAGYAVECGLKSCILVYLAANPDIIFEEKRYSEKCWSHGIDDLVKLANLDAIRDADNAKNPKLKDNWETVKSWKETSRYQQKTQAEAQELYDAIADNANGVMQWLRARW